MQGETITLREFPGGLVRDRDPQLLAPTECARFDNVVLSESGLPRKRAGHDEYVAASVGGNYTVNGGLGIHYTSTGTITRLICQDNGIWDWDGTVFRQLNNTSLAGKQLQILQMYDKTYIATGDGLPWQYNPAVSGHSVRRAGYPAPRAPMDFIASVAGSHTGNYKYVYSWVFDDGKESDPCPEWGTTTCAAEDVTLSWGQIDNALEVAPAGATAWRLYRFKDGYSETYDFVKEVTVGTTSYKDIIADGDEGDPHPALYLEDAEPHGLPPTGCHLTWTHGDRLFYAKGNTVYWSAVGEPGYFTFPATATELTRDDTYTDSFYGGFVSEGSLWSLDGGYREIEATDGDQIVAGVPSAGTEIAILKTNSIWLMHEEEGGFGVFPKARGVGCVASNSVAKTEVGTIWLGQDGVVWAFDGDSVKDLSTNRVRTMLSAMPVEDQKNCVGWTEDNKYFLAYRDMDITPKTVAGAVEAWYTAGLATSGAGRQTLNTSVLCYDLKRDCWSWFWKYPHEDGSGLYMKCLPVSAVAIGHAITDKVCLFGMPSNGHLWRWNYGATDDGTNIQMVVRTGDMDFGDANGWSRCGTVWVSALPCTGASLGIRQSLDKAAFGTSTAVSLTGSNRISQGIGTMANRFHCMALQVQELGASTPVEFWGFEFMLKRKGL